jgi:hypothetical protein
MWTATAGDKLRGELTGQCVYETHHGAECAAASVTCAVIKAAAVADEHRSCWPPHCYSVEKPSSPGGCRLLGYQPQIRLWAFQVA